MKILIISGTPKSDGLCHSLVTAAAEAAFTKGVETEVVKLSDFNLQRCKMCGDGWGSCYKQHRCAFGDEDGFNSLQDKYRDADAFVYITPVYLAEVSEVMNCFLNKLRRCQAPKLWNNNPEKSYQTDKPTIFAASAGGGGGGIAHTFLQMEQAVAHMGGLTWQWGGVYDYIAVNRWNQDYKREALKAAVVSMINGYKNGSLYD